MGEVRIRLLGGFEVEGVEPLLLGSRKARTLLKVLALSRGRAVSADRLAECLWPDRCPERPGEQVRVLVSRLRGVLGAGRLPRRDAGYSLVVDWLDVDALSELVDEASRRMSSGSPALARAACAAATALARGPLLPEEADAPWAVVERGAAERLMASARQVGAQAALAAGDLAGAARLAEGALDHDPYDEVVLRTLMTALAASGRPASALAAYAGIRARLADDLGVDPAADTEALHTAILLEQPLPGPVGGGGGGPPEDAASPLPARGAALASLDAALARAAAGEGGLVVVEGEAGMGKSRLLSTWAPRAVAAGATVLSAGCEELTRGLPLHAVLAALDDHLSRIGPARAADLLGPQAELLAPLLARAPVQPPGAGSPGPGSRSAGTAGLLAGGAPLAGLGDQAAGLTMVFAALVAVLSRGPGPTALLLDDIHLAGQSTVEWVHYAARRAAALPLLIVVAQRPEEAAPMPAATTVPLGPLDEAAAAQVVGPARAAELLARSGGNPLFLVQLAEADPTSGLPASVRDAVTARCHRAGPLVAATLRTAAVIGSFVDLDLLAAVLRASPVELLDHLEEGLRIGVLQEQAPGFVFAHELVRDALEAATTVSRRALTHREVGRALAARARPDPLAVAYHAQLGGDDDLAAEALIDAAAVASARFDQLEARVLLDRSISLADSLAGRLLRARVHNLLGDYDRATEDVDGALGLGGGAAALELGAWAAHYQRKDDVATALADGGVRSATDDEQKVGCLIIGGWARQCAGDLTAAESRLEEADRLATGIWRPVSEVWLGGLRVHQGRSREGVDLVAPATSKEAAVAHGYPAVHAHPVLHARLFSALGLAHLGRAEEALDAAAAIHDEEVRTGTVRWAGRADNTRGWILRGLGAWAEADDANQTGLERSAAIGMHEAMCHAHLDLAAGALLAGDPARATAKVAAAYDLGAGHAMAWRHRLRGHLYLGEIALAARDTDVAEQLASEVGEQAAASGTTRYVLLAAILVDRARLAAGAPVDPAEVEGRLAALPSMAGMEAWRLTAAVAAAAGIDRWWGLAETRVAELAAHAGRYAPTLERAARETLDSMRTVSRRG